MISGSLELTDWCDNLRHLNLTSDPSYTPLTVFMLHLIVKALRPAQIHPPSLILRRLLPLELPPLPSPHVLSDHSLFCSPTQLLFLSDSSISAPSLRTLMMFYCVSSVICSVLHELVRSTRVDTGWQPRQCGAIDLIWWERWWVSWWVSRKVDLQAQTTQTWLLHLGEI